MKKLNNKGLGHVAVVLVFLALIAVGFAGYRVYKNSQDESKQDAKQSVAYENAFKKLDENFKNQKKISVDYDEDKHCYNTEQGPYDNGRLWCGVARAYYFKASNKEDARTVIEQIRHSLKEVYGSLSTAVYIDPIKETYQSKGLSVSGRIDDPGVCHLRTEYPISVDKDGYSQPRYYIPQRKISNESIVLVFDCLQRSEEKYYPFIEK